MTFALAAPATVRLRVLRDGEWVATAVQRPARGGAQTVGWDGAKRVGVAPRRPYAAVIEATDSVGTTTITLPFLQDTRPPTLRLAAGRHASGSPRRDRDGARQRCRPTARGAAPGYLTLAGISAGARRSSSSPATRPATGAPSCAARDAPRAGRTAPASRLAGCNRPCAHAVDRCSAPARAPARVRSTQRPDPRATRQGRRRQRPRGALCAARAAGRAPRRATCSATPRTRATPPRRRSPSSACKIDQFRGEAAFSTWLHRLTLNACRDVAARGARRAATTRSRRMRRVAPGRTPDRRGGALRAARRAPRRPRQRSRRPGARARLKDALGFSFEEISAASGDAGRHRQVLRPSRPCRDARAARGRSCRRDPDGPVRQGRDRGASSRTGTRSSCSTR